MTTEQLLTPDESAERLADRMCNFLVAQFEARGLPVQIVAEEMILTGATVLAGLIGAAATADILTRAASAIADQIQA